MSAIAIDEELIALFEEKATHLRIDGIEPGDPLIKVRSAIYAVAVRRRMP